MTDSATLPLRRHDFPADFVFGTATSAYQIEGHAQGGAGPTHWDSFAITPGNVTRAETGDLACDHLHAWADDLDLVAGAGLEAYRFSISWARVMPEGRGPVNAQGLDFYDRLVDGMLARGLKPALTLYHWELPSALADRGGWQNGDIVDWFADYAEVVARRIGDRVWSVAPINEPWCVTWLGHFEGVHAPGLRDIRATARAVHHVLLAHGTAIEALRALGLSNLGAVVNLEYALPNANGVPEATAAARHDALYNQTFLSALFHKRYPDFVLEGLEPHLPDGWSEDFERIARPLDWLGINYYTAARIERCDGPWPGIAPRPGPPPHTDMGWSILPEGLGHFLRRLPRDYTGTLPLYVTENGMAAPDRPDGGAINDTDRIGYLASHLDVARRALAEGVPLKGYFVWSLLDNYEWSFGYDKRFGLVHVDYATLARTPKASWHALRAFLQGPDQGDPR